jgi:hypothetical protein
MADSRWRIWLGWAGLFVGLAGSAWWLYFGVTRGSSQGLDVLGALLHTALPGVVFLVSMAIAWRWRFAGGVLLVIEGLFISIFGPMIFKHCSFMSVALLLLTGSLPLLASGILLILSYRRDLASSSSSQGEGRQD